MAPMNTPTIALIGAGSVVFAKRLITDILSWPSLQGPEIRPMNINMWGFNAALGGAIRSVGLCHSVQGTAERLARFMDVPFEELSFWCAGINHQAWYLDLRRGHGGARGKDLYPLLRQKMDDPE